MTTDNRTNEPTPEQVEAAAKALYCMVRGIKVQDFEWAEWVDAEKYRAEARAALEAAARAAQGAAPQAECNCGAGPGSAVCKKVCATRAAEYRKAVQS